MNNGEDLERVCEAVVLMESEEECAAFLEDLCTPQELRAMELRLTIAKLLLEGKVYSVVVKETGASTATIARVNKTLNYLSAGGYTMVFERLGAEMDSLTRAFLSLKTAEECERFFKDLCTPQEIAAIAQRLHVAMLLEEKMVYGEIVKQTGASSATISRVNKTLNYQTAGGYRTALERLGGRK